MKMKYYGDVLSAVKGFAHDNLGKRFVIEDGIFEGEEATVVGYTDRDGFGVPSVIVELPETSLDKGWGLDQLYMHDHVIADVAEDVQLWYVDINALKEC